MVPLLQLHSPLIVSGEKRPVANYSTADAGNYAQADLALDATTLIRVLAKVLFIKLSPQARCLPHKQI